MNEKKLTGIFAKILELPNEQINDDLKYQGVERWDSIGHMAIIAALDEEFDLMIDTDDVIDMSSFKKAKEILAKYGVDFRRASGE